MDALEQLLQFLLTLRENKIHFSLDCVREAIMVTVPTPSQYYEIEFFADGHIETQTFGPCSEVQRISLQAITQKVIRDVNGT